MKLIILLLILFIILMFLRGRSDNYTSGTQVIRKCNTVAAGEQFACAITEGGGVKCWGKNNRGQLGNGTFVDSVIPQDVIGLDSAAVEIAAGYNYVCALLDTGKVKCWGDNSQFQLGKNFNRQTPLGIVDIDYHNVPVSPDNLNENVVSISLGNWGPSHGSVLLDTGEVKCWGRASNGYLSYVPGHVNGITNAIAIYTGFTGSGALLHTGEVKYWGGDSDPSHTIVNPETLITSPNDKIVEIAIGGNASSVNNVFFLLDTGAVKSFDGTIMPGMESGVISIKSDSWGSTLYALFDTGVLKQYIYKRTRWGTAVPYVIDSTITPFPNMKVGTFTVYRGKLLAIDTNGKLYEYGNSISVPGTFKTCQLPILPPCVNGNVTVLKNIALDIITSLDAYADNVSVITFKNPNNIVTYKNSGNPVISTLQDTNAGNGFVYGLFCHPTGTLIHGTGGGLPCTCKPGWSGMFCETTTLPDPETPKAELVCYDQYGMKYVYDNRGSFSKLWSILPDNHWQEIVYTGLDDIIDMCHDNDQCLFLLSNDFVITVINVDKFGQVNSINQYAARNSTFDGKGLYNCMTVSNDHTVYVSRWGRAIYKIEPFADESGNPLKVYDSFELQMSNGDIITVYDAIDPSEIIAGDPNTSGPKPLFNYITSMSIDMNGYLYVCDRDSKEIRCIYEDLSKTKTITTALNCPTIVRATNLPTGQCVLYVADRNSASCSQVGAHIKKIT